MKFSLFTLLIIAFFSSCTSTKEKLQGVWNYHHWMSSYSTFYYEKIEFKGDSLILLADNNIEYKTTYSIQNNTLTSEGITLTISEINDSILLLDSIMYVNKSHSAFRNIEKKIHFDLPEITEAREIHLSPKSLTPYIGYGTESNSNNQSFLFNDHYRDLDYVRGVLNPSSEDERPFVFLDRNLKMREVDSLLFAIQQPYINFVYLIAKPKSVNSDYGTPFPMRPFIEKEFEIRQQQFNYLIPPPEFLHDSLLIPSNPIFIDLDSENNVSFDGKKIQFDDLYNKYLNSLKEQQEYSYLFIYDENATYEKWLSVNISLRNAIDDYRIFLTNNQYGELIYDIPEDTLRSIRRQYPISLLKFDKYIYEQLVDSI